MAALSVQVPYPVFYDRDGQPLDNGNIYIGVANLDPVTNPLQVYYDEALTLTASQPLITSNGYVYRNGTPAQLYVNAVNFSILANDSKNLLVYSFPDGTGISQADASAISFTGFKGQIGTVADLADNDGSDWIGYISGGTGAIARSAQDKMRDIVNVKDFGATGDGVTDDTLAIQAAINYLSPLGGTLYIPKGAYIVSDADADNACLVITAPIQVLGDGAFYTSIQPAASVGSAVNTILVNPNSGYDQTLMSFKNLSLGNLNNGTRQGNYGIYCLTLNAGQNLPKFTVENCSIQQGGGYAIRHLNSSINNVNGGMYGAYINNNTLKGGIQLENSGDSIVVSNNILSGAGTGVHAALVAGASLLSILDNNITTTNSAIIIISGMRVHILRNNIEHSTVGSNSNAVIDIVASGGTYIAGVIQQNLIAAFGSTDATRMIFIRNARGTLIQDNTFLAGTSGFTGVTISATCTDVRIGPNTYNAAVTTKIVDLGVGTMGVVKSVTLQNSWVDSSAGLAPTFYKDLSGIVHINGAIKSGTATFGTTLFALPVGFRPSNDIYSSSFSNNGVSNVPGYIGVDSAGLVYFGAGGNTVLTTQASFVASDIANSVSPE